VLGFGGDALGIGGLALLGLPALLRAARARPLRRGDALLATLAMLALATWAAFVVTLVLRPQAEGDPIKAGYMLCLAPAFAVSALRSASGSGGARRSDAWRSRPDACRTPSATQACS